MPSCILITLSHVSEVGTPWVLWCITWLVIALVDMLFPNQVEWDHVKQSEFPPRWKLPNPLKQMIVSLGNIGKHAMTPYKTIARSGYSDLLINSASSWTNGSRNVGHYLILASNSTTTVYTDQFLGRKNLWNTIGAGARNFTTYHDNQKYIDRWRTRYIYTSRLIMTISSANLLYQ